MNIVIEKISDDEYKCFFDLYNHHYSCIVKNSNLQNALEIGKATAWHEYMSKKEINIHDTDFFRRMKKANSPWSAERYLDEQKDFESKIKYIFR